MCLYYIYYYNNNYMYNYYTDVLLGYTYIHTHTSVIIIACGTASATHYSHIILNRSKNIPSSFEFAWKIDHFRSCLFTLAADKSTASLSKSIY